MGVGIARRRMKDEACARVDSACWHIHVSGMVQGVGFRPFIFRLAQARGLKGWVLNNGAGVEIEIQGQRSDLAGFLAALPREKPPLAQIDGLSKEEVPSEPHEDFQIRASVVQSHPQVLIPPDLALCPQCREEVLADGERYHHYPFTNCTYCGPRFTVIKGLPYDRIRTSMADFTMCPECGIDYHNPAHRRFHAQPTACSRCGPEVALLDREGRPLPGGWEEAFHSLIKQGRIVAVKGIGGFHLVCSALDELVIQRLRAAKKRPARPLAVMARDIETVEKYCVLTPLEKEALLSPAAPIVILDTRKGTVPENLAPQQPTLGVMLPYSPLHLLLFPDGIDLLVMTSGNARGLPIVKDNAEAWRDLSAFTDHFLMHNREIVNRCDDSVVRVIQGCVHFYRRSRGYVPAPVALGLEAKVDVLGTGGEMKNTFCLLSGSHAFLSQHMGEMAHLEGLESYRYSLQHLQHLLEITPRVIGHDLHPQYSVNDLVKHLFECPDGGPGVRFFGIQHHHAHMAAAMADNALEGEVIGAILDGTGYGTDGTLWGFEILSGGYRTFTRQAHLVPVPLPGGEKAVLNPWLSASAYLLTCLGQEGRELAFQCFPDKAEDIVEVEKMLAHHVNSPLASSAGRLFDAAAALLGVCLTNTYDGQAALELGELARLGFTSHPLASGAAGAGARYPFRLLAGSMEIGGLLRGLVFDLQAGLTVQDIAVKFHRTVAHMVLAGVQEANCQTGLRRVVLSGGVWQNPLLLNLSTQLLNDHGFSVYTHRAVPANDGGLALGQAVAAYHMWLGE